MTPTTQQYREWKCQYNPETKELDYAHRHNCSDGFEDVRVIEYSALEALQKRVKELEAQIKELTHE